MSETRGVTEEGNVPSTSATKLETLVPQRKRRRSTEEVHASRLVRRRRTISTGTTEEAQGKWTNIEESIEFPMLGPRTNAAQ